jgi:hypothetical protein
MITIFMETRKEEHPLKIRSARLAIAEGYHLYMGNFRRIFRATWLPVLVCAVVSALYYQTMITTVTRLMAIQPQATTSWMAQHGMLTGVSVLNFIVSVVVCSYVFAMLAAHRAEGAIPYPTRWFSSPNAQMLKRTSVSAAVWIVTYIAAMVIPSGILYWGLSRQSVVTMSLGLFLMLVAIAFMLPLVYPNMRYLTTHDTRLSAILFQCYIQGLRHWGYIFSILFVELIILIVILSITMLPAIILISAGIKAQAGALMGDPIGMPSYMGWMSFLVYALSAFIQCYVVFSILFPAYYMAGNIEQQELQRNEKAANIIH